MEDALREAVSLGLKLGANQVETFASRTRTLYLAFEKKQVKRIEDRTDKGIGLRFLISGGGESSVGSSFTMSSSRDALEGAAKDALSVARTRRPEPLTVSFEKETIRRTLGARLVDRRVKDADISTAAALASRMIRVSSKDPRVRSVSGDAYFSYFEAFFLNSLGVEGHYDGTLFGTHIWVTAKGSGSIGSAFEGFASRTFNPEPAVEAARTAAQTALSQLKPRPVRPGRTDVILGPDALEGLSANILTFALRADFAQKNQSPLAGKIGQGIADESLTLEDDGLIPGYVGSKPFDDEGHAVDKRTIVERGMLRTYLYNNRTATGEGKESTGNALRVASPDMMRKYAGEPQILPHNLVIRPGKETLGDLISQVKEGIYAKSLIGAHTANRVSGEFSVVPQMAYKITRGEIEYPIKETVLSGNILDLLRNVRTIGCDLAHIPSISGDSSFTTPPLLVEGLSISG